MPRVTLACILAVLTLLVELLLAPAIRQPHAHPVQMFAATMLKGGRARPEKWPDMPCHPLTLEGTCALRTGHCGESAVRVWT